MSDSVRSAAIGAAFGMLGTLVSLGVLVLAFVVRVEVAVQQPPADIESSTSLDLASAHSYDDVCRQVGNDFAIAYSVEMPWEPRVLCSNDSGIWMMQFRTNGSIVNYRGVYLPDQTGSGWMNDAPKAFVSLRWGPPTNTLVLPEIREAVPADARLMGYADAYFYTEQGWSGANMTSANPVVWQDGDVRVLKPGRSTSFANLGSGWTPL